MDARCRHVLDQRGDGGDEARRRQQGGLLRAAWDNG